MTHETFIRPGLDVRFAVVDEIEKVVPTILAAAEPVSPSRGLSVTEHF
jgi:hypothetical protein